MPINIYHENDSKEVTWLCNDIWDLPTQVTKLEKWLLKEGKALPKGKYIADIGFQTRKDANGGGSVITSDMMRIMSEIDMDLYLSEYPNTNED